MDNFKDPKTWITLLIGAVVEVLLVGILNSAKHGVGSLWGMLIGIISLGSSRVRDLPYSSAALNPYPLPSLTLLFVAMSIIPVALASPIIGVVARKIVRRFLSPNDLLLATQPDRERYRKIDRRFRIAAFLLFTIELVTISQACLLAFSIEYEAVRIKRIFSADLAILKPQIDVRESAKLEAMFAGMHGKADAGVLAKALQDEATREGVTLRPERW